MFTSLFVLALLTSAIAVYVLIGVHVRCTMVGSSDPKLFTVVGSRMHYCVRMDEIQPPIQCETVDNATLMPAGLTRAGSWVVIALLMQARASIAAAADDSNPSSAVVRQLQALDAANGCGAVLRAGVYNTIQTSSSGYSFSEAHQAACNDYSDYTYECVYIIINKLIQHTALLIQALRWHAR
jgi:hypothetical protein